MASSASKFGVLVGGTCVLIYSLRINYFPQDLSLGDGLLFLLAAACFGVIYVFFTASLVSLGMCLAPVVRVGFSMYTWGSNRFLGKSAKPVHQLAKFEWPAVLLALFAVFSIFALGRREIMAYWNLPLLSIALYLFYSVYLSSGNKIKEIDLVKNSLLHIEDKENFTKLGDPEKLRAVQLFSLLTILIVPLLCGGVSGQLLDAAMRGAQLRIEKPIIYVREPYSSLFPRALVSKRSAPKDYTAFDGTVILFKGFGKTTVVSFPDGSIERKLEIPNDQIIVEKI